ncbi:MAG: septal ring lytic transglycosylase RlpA family protein [bacterium]|nr:septal ring lytic transglycosylase RlpA family protein [bacterium]
MKHRTETVGHFRSILDRGVAAFGQSPALRLPAILIVLSLGTACATTNIQTGGSQGTPESTYASRADDPEATFFNDLSAQDDAFQDGAPEAEGVTEVATTAGDDCPCEATEQTVADATTEESTTPGETGDSYFDSNQQPAKQPETTKPVAVTESNADDSDYAPPASGDFNEVGTASWYGRDFNGKPTANGEIFDSRKLTAAHKKIPLGSIVLVRNLENNREALVTINDRGPFVKGRVLDMSEYGAETLGYKEQGLTTVGIRVVRLGKGKAEAEGATKKFFDEDGQAAAMGSDEVDLNASDVEEDGDSRHYALQVGAFSDLKNARSLERYLKHYGQPLKVVRRDGMFAVKIGAFDSRYEAEQLKARLGAEGYSAFVSEPGRN